MDGVTDLDPEKRLRSTITVSSAVDVPYSCVIALDQQIVGTASAKLDVYGRIYN